MPEMTGETLAKLVREICPGLPLFIATGYSDQDKGGVDLPRLAKPFHDSGVGPPNQRAGGGPALPGVVGWVDLDSNQD
jgi:hypothetical protein